MTRKFTHAAAAVLIIAALLPAGRLLAQGAEDRIDPEMVRLAIERTDEVIGSAREIVQETRSLKARTALEYAMELQNRAKNSSSISNNTMAYKFTIQARNEAWHAVNLARNDARQEELYHRVAERTRERLVMLRARMVETGIRDERTMRLMQESHDLIDKADVNHQQLRGELALKLSEGAFRLADQAEKQFKRAFALMEMCQRRLTLLEGLAERTGAIVADTGDEKAASQLRKAEEQLARGREMFTAGRYDACKANLEKAEKMLRNVTRSTIRNQTGEPEFKLAEALMLLQRAEEMIGSHSGAPENAYLLLEQARRMLQRAESEMTGGNGDEAYRLMEQARRMLRSAVEEAETDVDPDQATDEIDRAADTGEQVRATIEQCEAEGVRNLYERANSHMTRARENLDKGLRERAVVEARIARNLFNRIREICNR